MLRLCTGLRDFLLHKIFMNIFWKGDRRYMEITQQEVRRVLKEKTERCRQSNIQKQTGIPQSTLSKFMNGKLDLWDEHLQVLAKYVEDI